MSGSFPPPGGPTGTPPPPGPGPGGPTWGHPSPPPSLPGHPGHPGQPGPAWSGAAHKPGAVPLRPLGLGDLYDAAFRIIRHNPAATVGSAVLVAAVAMAIPVVVSTVLSSTYDLSSIPFDGTSAPTQGQVVGFLVTVGSLVLGAVLQSIGLILVTGMVAHVAMAATLGRTLSIGQAWAATRGQRGRLLGMTFLLVLMMIVLIGGYVGLWVALIASGTPGGGLFGFGLVSLPAFVALLWWFWIRVYYLAVPALMLEGRGVLASLGRGRALTKGVFWRTFGIALLTAIISQVGGMLLAMPVTLGTEALVALGGVDRDGVLLVVLSNAVSSVVAAAFVTPFAAAVAALQYVDLRIRKEAFDVELVTAAGLSRP